MIEQAVYERLKGFAGLTALVGTRIYSMFLPQDPGLPAVTYQRISTERARAKDGPSGDTTAGFSVTVWAGSPESLRSVADQVRLALDGWSGTQADVRVAASGLENEFDQYDSDVRVYQSTLDFAVQFDE